MSTINICIDFDGTIAEEPFELFPECGKLKHLADEVIQRLEARGFTISIWTCRTGDAEIKCKEFLKKHQIPYHYFNEHSKESIEKYGTSEGKKISGIYIDNQSLEYKLNGMPTWDQLEIMINQLKHE
jgi:uncharacterized HAD superfamily protein